MVGDEGSIALGEAITNNTVLHTLGLGNNSIKVDGTRALATMLESNQSLQRLMLENNIIHDADHRNCIGNAGTEALAKMLENNRTLYFLNLTEAGTTADSVRKLADAIDIGNTSIIKLAVHPNLDPKLERLLARNMQTHRASQKLKAKLKKMRTASRR
jgi:Ran GTPase-activating protein (RanGAP) involved in mRNA processing and transport